MTDTLDATIAAVAGALKDISDPIERYQAIVTLDSRIDEVRKEARRSVAQDLHDGGRPWREVGELMGGVSAQRAWQIARSE